MKVYCNKCDKYVNTKNNKCPNCGMIFDEEVVEQVKNIELRQNRKKNIISSIFNIIGTILLIGGLFVAIVFGAGIGNNELGFLTFLIYAVCYFLVSMFMFAIAEVIQLLYDIRNKLYEKQ
jgi:uncharacterized membrane protein